MASLSESSHYQYQAFISYCHQDEKWGIWLHRALERYRVPRYLVGKKTPHTIIPRRLTPIFRDRDELPTATDLGKVVNEALQRSACLIVICSPHAARSRWVNQEILSFKRQGRSDRIFCLIVGGEPEAARKPELEAQECFPEALRYALGPDGTLTGLRTEPIAADVRPHGDGKATAKLKVIAGLLGVGLDELKHREQHRRHQRMVAVTAMALVAMIITTLLAVNAIVARGEADYRRAQADDLINFMLVDLRQNLEPVGRLDALDIVIGKVLAHYSSVKDHEIKDEERGKLAAALCLIGDIRMNQGKLDEAMTVARDCLAQAKTLHKRNRSNEQWLFLLGQAHFWVGAVHWERGNLDVAARGFQEYLAISQQLVALNPGNSEWQFELSYAYNNQGTVLRARGDVDAALEQFRISIATKEMLVAQYPARSDWMLELADSYSWFGTVLQETGRLDEALELHRKDVAITESVLATDREDANTQWRLSVSLRLLAELLEDLGDREAAVDRFEQDYAIITKLVAHDPANADWKHDLGKALAGLGRGDLISGDLGGALQRFQELNTIMDRLMALDGSRSGWRRDAAAAHYWTGETLLAMGDPEAARQEVNRAIAIIGQLLVEAPDGREAIPVAGDAYMLSGQISARTGGGAEPAVAFKRAVEILEPIANGTTDKTFLDPWARALLHLDRVDAARPVVKGLQTIGFDGWRLGELCQDKGVLMEG